MDFRNLFMYAILLSDYSNVYLIWKVIFLSPSCISGQKIHCRRYYSIISIITLRQVKLGTPYDKFLCHIQLYLYFINHLTFLSLLLCCEGQLSWLSDLSKIRQYGILSSTQVRILQLPLSLACNYSKNSPISDEKSVFFSFQQRLAKFSNIWLISSGQCSQFANNCDNEGSRGNIS